MAFIADKQTLDDLNLLDRYSSGSIFVLFNQVKTKGGRALLEKMFRNPLTDAREINQRSATFKYFQTLNLEFPLPADQFTIMEEFLHAPEQPNWFSSFGSALRRKSLHLIGLQEEYTLFINSVSAISELLRTLDIFFENLLKKDSQTPFEKNIIFFRSVYHDSRFKAMHSFEASGGISFGLQVRLTHLLGNVFYERMHELLGLLYELDVYLAVSRMSAQHKFSYATALPAQNPILHIDNCRYPALKNARGNDISLNSDVNVLFVTGANMAGKSTLMKAVGVAVYLAHMGFPVAADQMEFSVMDGVFSSINLPDDINQGLSHFYAEVLRVKTVAEEVNRANNLLVIFDELFKGTNVRDAYDATLAVTQAFAEHRNCYFIISTHILEVAVELQETHKQIQFSFMPTIMTEKAPSYTYQLTEGVSSDRHGMMIIENEGILDMLNDQ
jgi:DNA mismatch repair protein MutS